jgi:ferrous iron transport protein A
MSETGGEGGRRLAEAAAGSRVRIGHVDSGHGLRARLLGMGLKTGVDVDVRRNDGGGPVVIGLGHGRIALGRRMAEKVWVC